MSSARPSKPIFAPLCGSTVPPDRVVGREEKIKEMWTVLESQSVLLTSERRIGKTAILNKMAAEPPAGWKVVYRQVEGVSSPEELVKVLHQDLSRTLGADQSIFIRLRGHYERLGLGGTQLGSITLPQIRQEWKDALLALLADADAVKDYRVVIIWDEFPNMVWKVAQEDPKTAADLVDLLRSHRQSLSSRTRFVLAGSIGFNLVIRHLLDVKAHRGRPTNDLRTIHAGALSSTHAAFIAREGLEYLEAEGKLRLAAPLEDLAKMVAGAADRIPFYIEHLVYVLAETPRPIRVEDVGVARDRLIRDDTGNHDFRHYRNRIRDYYPEAERSLCFDVLDALAAHPLGLTVDELLTRIGKDPSLTRSRLRDALDFLKDDHYVYDALTDQGVRYSFRYALVRDWWLAGGR